VIVLLLTVGAEHTTWQIAHDQTIQPVAAEDALDDSCVNVEQDGDAADGVAGAGDAGPAAADTAYDPDMIPGVDTAEDVIAFYGKFGQDSSVKFFYCVRLAAAACRSEGVHVHDRRPGSIGTGAGGMSSPS